MGSKIKPPAFLLCENPISDKSDGITYILHNRTPKLLAHVHAYQHLTNAEVMQIQQQIPVGSRLDYGTETFFFTPVWLEPTEATNAQDEADKLAALFRRMADWYKAYLIWEDAQ